MGETPINVAYPLAEDLSLRVALGACRFAARPSEEGEAWVAGICYDPSDKRSPRVIEEGGVSRSRRPSSPSSGFRPSSGVFPATSSSSVSKDPSHSP